MNEAVKPAIPPTVKGLSLVSLFNDFASEMVYPLLPAFVVGTLGGSAALLGILDGAADLTAAATKWVSGDLADRPRWRKPLIVLGYFSAILIRPFMAAASAAWQVVGFRVVDRLGKGLRTPARDAFIADATAPEMRGRAFGFHRAADHFGSIPGALLAWWLLRHSVDVRQVLTWSIVPGVVAGLVLLFVLRNAPVRIKEAAAEARDATGRVFWGPVIALAGMVLLRLPETLLLLRLQDLGVAVATVPLVWAGLHVVRSFVSYPGGWLVDRVGPRGTVALGGVVFAALAAGLGVARGEAAAIGVFLLLGLVAGLTEPAERAMVSRLAPKRTGRGFGAYHAVTGLAALPAAALFGVIYQQAGGNVALYASALGMLVVTMLWLLVAPKQVAA
ncbi:MAG: MFS transporter [Gemmatimonadales bacterium]